MDNQSYFYYDKKNINSNLIDSFSRIGLLDVQNYNPLYDIFFHMEGSQWKTVNLKLSKGLFQDIKPVDDNLVSLKYKKGYNVNSFVKFSPLIEPIKYIEQKIDIPREMPNPSLIGTTLGEKRLMDPNNRSYIDGFFSYLSSLLKNNGFVHGLDFYGMFLGKKNNFKFNVEDDIDDLFDNTFFNNGRFRIHDELRNIYKDESRKWKPTLSILEEQDIDIDIPQIETSNNEVIEDIKNTKQSYMVYNNEKHDYPKGINPDIEDDIEDDIESISSNDSDTENEDEDEEEYEDEDTIIDTMSSCTSIDSSIMVAYTDDYPVNAIFLEKLHDTLDSYLMNSIDKITANEFSSILFQIIYTLMVYQEIFDFTHNDLHTNNIMFVETDKEFLYYKINKIVYKVPTYGKIYKIIDFGRSIYTFKENVFCSDSYHPHGDAYSQYNFPEQSYYRKDKKNVKPNKGFDLCRLACSLYDDIKDKHSLKSIHTVINTWLCDYRGKNVLYKSNGKIRYDGFKLYKMIARSIDSHIPREQFDMEIFTAFRLNDEREIINHIMNLDDYRKIFKN
jgi:hypothetical protein